MRELLMLCLQTAAPTFSLFGMRELSTPPPFLLLLWILAFFVWWGAVVAMQEGKKISHSHVLLSVGALRTAVWEACG